MLLLEPLGRGSGADQGQHCLCPALGHLDELQSDLKIVAACAGLGGNWESLSCEPRQAATSSGLGVTKQEVQGKSRPDADYVGLVNL